MLLSVLREAPDDKAGLREALATAVSEINRSEGTEVSQIREAIRYLILLILHQCSEEEQPELIQLVDRYTSDNMEVIGMARTAAEALIEQGRREILIEGILENLEVAVRGRRLATRQSKPSDHRNLTTTSGVASCCPTGAEP